MELGYDRAELESAMEAVYEPLHGRPSPQRTAGEIGHPGPLDEGLEEDTPLRASGTLHDIRYNIRQTAWG